MSSKGSYLLANETPYDALCHYFNVSSPRVIDYFTIPTVLSMSVRNSNGQSLMPTHILAAIPTNPNPSHPVPPILLPINATLYQRGFDSDAEFLSAGSTTLAYTSTTITLPVIQFPVPHPPSLSLLLLFAMRLETQHGGLGNNLLPTDIIGNFPDQLAMASSLAAKKQVEFDRVYGFVQGVWHNILALGYRDGAGGGVKIVELVKNVRKVVGAGARIRQGLPAFPESH
ncbi:hypothetical protein FA15DRAFT_700103 [Coprinopsis marcescibilis]|uniref:Uncharacterized protein n=1 Tax=Coprinopsis marcescibilis TaxID=230819 RepID=A0A5C3LAS2_COPMA|nr:hypothetical protein FA15DRAFT_700103 [Coprinopsis marcescibilis]